MNETLLQIKESVNNIANGFYYIFHPIQGGKVLFLKMTDSSYNIVLVLCFCSIFLYICGSKKGKKIIPCSMVIYTLLQAISSVMKVK